LCWCVQLCETEKESDETLFLEDPLFAALLLLLLLLLRLISRKEFQEWPAQATPSPQPSQSSRRDAVTPTSKSYKS
jgi:hypothetical protein